MEIVLILPIIVGLFAIAVGIKQLKSAYKEFKNEEQNA